MSCPPEKKCQWEFFSPQVGQQGQESNGDAFSVGHTPHFRDPAGPGPSQLSCAVLGAVIKELHRQDEAAGVSTLL